jgi:transposase
MGQHPAEKQPQRSHLLSPYLYRARNRVERFFNRIKWQRATTSLPPITLPLFSSRLSGYGWRRAYESTP